MPTIAEIKTLINSRVRGQQSHIMTNGIADILDEIIDGLVSRVGPTPPVSIHEAVLNQSGTGAPVQTALNSNLEIVWARTSQGIYSGTAVGAFVNPTTVLVGTPQEPGIINAYRLSDDVIRVESFDIAGDQLDSLLVNTYLEIKIYNELA